MMSTTWKTFIATITSFIWFGSILNDIFITRKFHNDQKSTLFIFSITLMILTSMANCRLLYRTFAAARCLNYSCLVIVLFPLTPLLIFIKGIKIDNIDLMLGFHTQTIIQFIPLTILHIIAYILFYDDNENDLLFIISIVLTVIDILVQLLVIIPSQNNKID
eukprot:11811_1